MKLIVLLIILGGMFFTLFSVLIVEDPEEMQEYPETKVLDIIE